MEVSAERILSITFPDHESAKAVKDKLRHHGVHASLSPAEDFERWPGREKWEAAHRILTIVDHFPQVGDTMEMVRNILRKK